MRNSLSVCCVTMCTNEKYRIADTASDKTAKSRNFTQERPTQIYAYFVLYTVGGM